LKSLIVYYTRTGNARFVAETIAAEIGADLEEVVDLKKRTGVFAYLSGGSDARRGKQTQIAAIKKSPADYDLVIVGTPVWAGRPTPAILTYLENQNLSDKKVALFFTQGGKKPRAINETKALIPNSECIGELTLINPLETKANSEKQIVDWCKTLIVN
jgi:flavodoxin